MLFNIATVRWDTGGNVYLKVGAADSDAWVIDLYWLSQIEWHGGSDTDDGEQGCQDEEMGQHLDATDR